MISFHFFFIFGSFGKVFSIWLFKTFPKNLWFQKLFRGVSHGLMKNIYPCTFLQSIICHFSMRHPVILIFTWSNLVSLDSLYGTWPGLLLLKLCITLPSVVSDKFILLLSLKFCPSSVVIPKNIYITKVQFETANYGKIWYKLHFLTNKGYRFSKVNFTWKVYKTAKSTILGKC